MKLHNMQFRIKPYKMATLIMNNERHTSFTPNFSLEVLKESFTISIIYTKYLAISLLALSKLYTLNLETSILNGNFIFLRTLS